jgi:hypothetical protein
MAGYGGRVPFLVVKAPAHLTRTRWELNRDVLVLGSDGV